MTSTGTAVAASGGPAGSSAEPENIAPSSRATIVVAALDSVSLALFYLPFSSVADVIGGMWCRMFAGD